MTQIYSSNYHQLPTEMVSNHSHTHHLDQGIFFCLFCQFLYIFFNHIFSKCLIDYYILISMKIMLEKAPKTLTRLSDPGPIEKSPLWPVSLCMGWKIMFTKQLQTISKVMLKQSFFVQCCKCGHYDFSQMISWIYFSSTQ